jgi:transketolase
LSLDYQRTFVTLNLPTYTFAAWSNSAYMYDIHVLERTARAIRERDVRMIANAKYGHIGGDLSSTDIITALFFKVLNVDPASPRNPNRDRFVLSKGHSCGALYTAMALRGFFPPEELATFMRPNSRLNGHPDRKKIAGIETNTGPLGHGMPVAVGMAIGAKMSGAAWKTYVLTGDGELQEGSNWEAAMLAAHRKLDNLVWIVDRNRLQQGDRTEFTNALEPLAAKIGAFGWEVRTIDGNDMPRVVRALSTVPLAAGKPTCIIAETTKGRGVSFIEDRVEWHHRVPTADELARAIEELTGVAQ